MVAKALGKEGRARRDPTRSRMEPTVHVGDLYATGEKRGSFSFCKHFPDFSHKKNGHHLHEKVRSLSLSSAPHSQSSVKSNTANDTCRATVWASPGPELQASGRAGRQGDFWEHGRLNTPTKPAFTWGRSPACWWRWAQVAAPSP